MINAEGDGVVEYVDANEIRVRYDLSDDERTVSFIGEVKSYPVTNFKEPTKTLVSTFDLS